MEKQENRLFYGWSVVLGCAVVCGCNIGVLSNTVGVFLKPVSMELGGHLVRGGASGTERDGHRSRDSGQEPVHRRTGP